MNDDFLKQFRQKPSKGFAKDLYARISQSPQGVGAVKARFFAFRPLAIGFIALILVFAATLTFSPSVRAFVTDILREIGGITFIETDQYPSGDGSAGTVPTELMTLGEAQAQVPYPIQLPAWLPEGSVRLDLVRVTEFPDFDWALVTIEWEIIEPGTIGSGLPTFRLAIWPYFGESRRIVGVDAIEEVSINGLPAALFKGGWDLDLHEWNSDIPVFTLTWRKGGEVYNLDWPSQLSLDDLIRVAESIP